MADTRTFTLVGKFDDQITKKLKDLNKQLETLGKFGKRSYDPFKGMKKGIEAANSELKAMEKELSVLKGELKQLNKFDFKFDKSGIQAAAQEVRVLGKEIDAVAQKGFHFDKSGIQAAQQEARVLGDILKANALIQAGQGVAGAGAAGFRGGIGALGKVYSFIAARAKDAAQDQLQDVQARGSLFGSLNKEQLFANAKNVKDQEKLRDINEKNYDTTRSISRSMEGAIADVVKSSTVSTATITTLSRQLSDNLLPSMLKAKGVTDLSKFEGPEGRKELDKLMGGEKGVGKELATLYEQMGSIITSPQYAPQAAMGFTQFLGQGTINKQLAIFEQNPVLVDAMKKYMAEFGNTTEGRIKALKKALEVAMPEAALQEARQTLMGGIQSVSDTLTNANAGILSMGADIAGQGQKTLEMARKNGTIKLQEAAFERRQGELRDKWEREKTRTAKEMADRDKMEAEQRKKFARDLQRIYENADSPIEVIAASFGPLMQRFADFLGSTRNLFIDPVMAIMNRLQPPLAKLMDNLEALGSDVRAGERTFAEALGRAFAEFFKAIATLFDPKGVAEQGGSAIQKAFQDFAKGFRSAEIDGKKYLDIVLKGIQDFLMKALFNEGNVLKGLTPLGDGIVKVFALLAAPAFINALITGLTPLLLQQTGSMFMGIFGKVGAIAKADIAKRMAANAYTAPIGPAGIGPFGPTAPMTGAATTSFGAMLRGVLAPLARLTVVVTAIAAALVLFGGGIDSTMRQLTEFGGEVWSSLGGVLSGIGDTFGVLFGFIGDLGAAIGGWIGGIFGVKGELDGLKILLAIITLPLQALEMGLKGLALALAWVRMKLTEWFGSEEDKKKARDEVARLDRERTEAQGRINAYNASMLGSAEMKKQRDAAWKELSTSKKLNAARSAELRTFISETDKRLANKPTTSTSAPAQAAAPARAAARPSAAAAAAAAPIVPPAVVAANAASVTKVTQGNNAVATSAVSSAKKVNDSANKQAVTMSKIIASWEKSNVTSQAKLAAAAAGLASAINAAAAKIKAASAGLGGVTSPSPTGGEGNKAAGKWDGKDRKPVPLEQAIAEEKKNMPSGAHLVIANSSETIIPASNGLNLGGLAGGMDKFTTGLNAVGKMAEQLGGLGGLLGGASGNLGLAHALAKTFGLTLTSFKRNGGGGSYHDVGRAMDFSNSTGPTPQMMAFAQAMVSRFGRSITELIYTPLGFGIKHGRKVPPYAASSHYNHVHVAFGLGPAAMGGGGAMGFGSLSDARNWERRMAPRNAAIASVTSNSSEFGGGATINAPITINAGAGQDASQIADAVVTELERRIARAQSSSLFFS